MFIAHQYDPTREPNWRAARAQYLVTGQQRARQPTRHDDEFVRAYRKFLMAWRRGGPAARERLVAECPGMYYAHMLSTHPDQEWKAIMEAKLLARMTDEMIAAELNTIPDAPFWYEALFFDVRSRLHARTYIMKMILGPAARRALDYDDVLNDHMRFMVYKSMAYFGGPMMLDFAICGHSNIGSWPRRADDMREHVDKMFKMDLRQRSLTTANTFTVNRFNAMELMQMHVTLIGQVEAAKAAGGGGNNEYTRNLELFFEQMPIGIGDAAFESRSPELQAFEQTAIEPRAAEMIKLAEGTVPPGLVERAALAPDIDIKDDDNGQ
jgi:hypothetical protein